MRFVAACFLVSHLFAPFFCLASPLFVSRGCHLQTCFTLREWLVIALSPISLERVRALCRSMGSAGGGRALAEGKIPCLRYFMPQHVSVGLMCVFSLVLHVLTGAYGSLVITDKRFLSILYLVNLVDRFAFVEPN